jgi:hypothetical protein
VPYELSLSKLRERERERERESSRRNGRKKETDKKKKVADLEGTERITTAKCNDQLASFTSASQASGNPNLRRKFFLGYPTQPYLSSGDFMAKKKKKQKISPYFEEKKLEVAYFRQ